MLAGCILVSEDRVGEIDFRLGHGSFLSVEPSLLEGAWYVNRIIPGKGLNIFAEMEGLRIVRGKSAKALGTDKDYFRPDFFLVPQNMSDDQARMIARDSINKVDRNKAGFVEAKSPTVGPSPRQKKNFTKMVNAGRADIFFIYQLPHEKLTAESLTESVSNFFSPGRKLSPAQTAAILQVTEEIKRTMSEGTPIGDVFLACVYAAATVLGVSIALDSED